MITHLRRILTAGITVITILGATPLAAAAAPPGPGPFVCTGGSIPPGTYTRLVVAGNCQVPDGSDVTVTVLGNVRVNAGATLDAPHFGTLDVHGSVHAGSGSTVTLEEQTIGGDVVARNALAVELGSVTVKGSVRVRGSSSTAATCVMAKSPNIFNGVYLVQNTIAGNVRVTGWTGCLTSINGNTIGGSMTVNRISTTTGLWGDNANNTMFGNSISGNLTCRNITPAPQLDYNLPATDPSSIPNQVAGHARGQCTSLAVPRTG